MFIYLFYLFIFLTYQLIGSALDQGLLEELYGSGVYAKSKDRGVAENVVSSTDDLARLAEAEAGLVDWLVGEGRVGKDVLEGLLGKETNCW